MSTVTAIRTAEPNRAIGQTATGAALLRPLNAPATATPASWNSDGFEFMRAKPPAPATSQLPYTEANHVKLFVGDYDTYDEALRLIGSARTSIQFETFTFNSEQGRGIAAALIQARQRGVNVQVILDSKSMLLAHQYSIAKDMMKKGVEVRVYQERNLNSPLIAIDHTKMLVIDGETALVGGTNFDRRRNYDLNFEVSGPVLPAITGMFDQSRANSKAMGKPGQVATAPSVPAIPATIAKPRPDGFTRVGITQTSPKTDPHPELQTLPHTLAAIHNATESIDLLMFKMDDDREMAALEAAYQRGVKLRVILNRDSFNQYAALRLQRAGIPVQWFKLPKGYDELHAKLAIFDHKTVLGGSTNWVQASNYDNHEMGVWVQGESVDSVQKLYDGLWSHQTRPIDKLKWKDKVKAWVVDHLDFVF